VEEIRVDRSIAACDEWCLAFMVEVDDGPDSFRSRWWRLSHAVETNPSRAARSCQWLGGRAREGRL